MINYSYIWLSVQVLLHQASSSGYPLFFGLGETSRGMFACFLFNQQTFDAKNNSRFSEYKNKT